MKKLVCVCTTLLLSLFAMFVLSSCSTEHNGWNYQEEEERIMDLAAKSWYGDGMQFYFRIVVNGEARILDGLRAWVRLDHVSSFHDPFYTDLIFVHNEAEADALNLPDNIIVAWPRDPEWTEGLIAGIHWAVDRSEDDLTNNPAHRGGLLTGFPVRGVVTLEEFGLSYPITIEDLVDNWEKVNALWTALTSNEHEFIQRAASAGGPLAPDPAADLAPVGGDGD